MFACIGTPNLTCTNLFNNTLSLTTYGLNTAELTLPVELLRLSPSESYLGTLIAEDWVQLQKDGDRHSDCTADPPHVQGEDPHV